MGAGKTTAARAAAAALGARAVDSDHLLEEQLGQPIEDYFAEHGEAAFRAVEERVVCALLDAPPGPVLSLGGGAVVSPRVRAALARHTVVLLDVDTATAWHRAGGRRPLARDRARFEALHAERRPLYDAVADVVLTDSARDVVRRAVPAMTRCAPRRRHAHGVGAHRLGRLPGASSAAACSARRRRRAAGARSSSPTRRSAPLYADGRGRGGDDDRRPARRGGEDVGAGRARAARASRRRGWTTTTTCSRSAAASSATSPASAPRPTSAACPSSSCRRRSSRRSTPPTAARRASTSRRARTTPAPTTSPRPCSPTRRCWPRCRPRSSRPAGPRSSRPR